ncbi:MAG: UDP-N-acetylmuramoyl-L-alanine--D-glutamate ligase [Pseudomonadota bacterium]
MSGKTTGRDFVFGLGGTGLSVARHLKRLGREAVFADTRDAPPGLDELAEMWPDAEVLLGNVDLVDGIDRVIVSPGIVDTHPLLTKARARGIDVVSDIELFAVAAKAPYVAITGSNGKSTVTTLLRHMCEAANLNVLAGGNLGTPALDLLEQETPDWYVLEVSSFHLQRTEHLPTDVAVLLNITPDHLDWHADFEEYREAKHRIFNDAKSGVFNRDDDAAATRAEATGSAISFGADAPADAQFGLAQDDDRVYLARGDVLLLDVHELAMVGYHNQLNALAALAAGQLMQLPLAAMLQVLCEFPGLPHRMQRVRRLADIDFINDSKATNVAAAVASIQSIDGMLVLIAGGEGKGGDFSQLAVALEGKLRAAVLIGVDAEQIAAALDTVRPVQFASDMRDAVEQAAGFAEAGDTVLLAPACASFDQFDNYMARGDAFADAARELRL